jgi:hypothetical protein
MVSDRQGETQIEGKNVLRTLVESPQYSEQLAGFGNALGGVSRIDDALRGVTYALSRRPEVYDVLPGFRELRWAPTDRFEGPEGVVPELTVLFTIPNEHEVHLLWIEAYEEDY